MSTTATARTRLRRVLLLLTATVFATIAVAATVAPHTMAAGLGYTLGNIDALNEFRAVYVGLWLATAVVFVVAARHVGDARLGDLAALLVLGQAVGRTISLIADGVPSTRMWPMFAIEAIGGVVLLLLRPSPGAAASRGSGAAPPPLR